ncbi:hypothetical protein Tco_1357872, partial [Tanacetum coccineum]
LEQEVAKKQKIDDDKEKAELQSLMEIASDKEDEAIDVIPLATNLQCFKLIKDFDGEDLENLWRLVKAKHRNTRPKEAFERVLWGDLKVMFELDIESEVWRNLQGYKVTVWKLFDSCGVHFLRFQNLHIYMLVEKRYPLTPATITDMLDKKLAAGTNVTTVSVEELVLLCMRTRSSSNLLVESSMIPKRHNHRRSKQIVKPELRSIVETPVVTMADKRTMLLSLVTSSQFHSFERDDPHSHIRWFNKITSTIKYKNVPHDAIKLMLFPFSLNGAAQIWLEKEPPRSIPTWEDLQRFDESFGEA